MRLHHLNCGSLHPYWPRIDNMVYCLLLETDDGLLLVDTGFGLQDYRRPTPFTRTFTRLLRSPRDEGETAVAQVQGLGYEVADVRHIVMTHLHIDHAGGLPDFPDARVHVHAREFQAIQRPRGFKERFYVQGHWSHGPRWVVHHEASQDWFGLPAIPVVPGLRPRVLMIPLPGHSRGHCGVAVENDNGWLLHCGDATYPFFHDGHPDQPIDSPPMWLVDWLMGPHTDRLRALQQEHGDEIEMICSHDPVSFAINRALASG